MMYKVFSSHFSRHNKNLNNIKGCYYQIDKEQIIKIFNLIEKYFKTYSDKFQLNFAFGKRTLK
jgi:hypothetical protein